MPPKLSSRVAKTLLAAVLLSFVFYEVRINQDHASMHGLEKGGEQQQDAVQEMAFVRETREEGEKEEEQEQEGDRHPAEQAADVVKELKELVFHGHKGDANANMEHMQPQGGSLLNNGLQEQHSEEENKPKPALSTASQPPPQIVQSPKPQQVPGAEEERRDAVNDTDIVRREALEGSTCPPNAKRFVPPKDKLLHIANPCTCSKLMSCRGEGCRTFTSAFLATSVVFPASCEDCRCVETRLFPPGSRGEPESGPSVIVIGIGSGRCGTHTLSALLSGQGGHTAMGRKEVTVTHERVFQWGCPRYEWPSVDFPFSESAVKEKAEIALKTLIARFPHAKITGDIAHFHLPYVRHMLLLDKRVKVVVLQRKKEDTIPSWVRWWGLDEQRVSFRFPFLDTQDREAAQAAGMKIGYDVYWDRCFPRYKFESVTPSLEDGIERHYNTYYTQVDQLLGEFAPQGRIRKYDTYELLGDHIGEVMEDLFQWIGVPKPYRKVVIQHSRTQ